jgi:adenylate cyclase
MERKLTAILHADVAGYSRLMSADEEATLRTLHASRTITDSLIAQHRGRIVGTAGDSILAEFASVVEAVQCAVEIQQALKTRNSAVPPEQRMEFRIGINLGDVMVEGEQIYGEGVNIAARLESLADPGGIYLSGTAYDQVKNKLSLGYDYLGEQIVKNITEPVRVYRVGMEDTTSQKSEVKNQKAKVVVPQSPKVRPAYPVVAGLMLIAGVIAAVQYVPFFSFRNPQSSIRNQEAQPPSLPLPDQPSIVVLPFDNMSGDPQQDYFSNGITEVLTSDLSRISSLFVIARNTAFSIGRSRKVQEVGRELDVRYVLEGSVQKAADQVRIVAQLIDATTGGHIWSERYDRPLTDIFALQDEIVQKIVTTLKLQLTLQEQGFIVRKRTDNVEAYDSFLRGVEYFWRTTKEANTQARQLFEQAVALDPQYAEAYVWLGYTYSLEWVWRWSADPQTLESALALAQQALALDDSVPEAHSLLSQVYTQRQQYDQAIAEGERAIALAPNNDFSYDRLGEVLSFAGRPAEGLPLIEQAMRLNPRAPVAYLMHLGFAYYLLGRYPEVVATVRTLLVRNPNWLPAYFLLSASYVAQWTCQLGQDPQTLAQALAAAQRALTLNAASPQGHGVLGTAYLWQKQYEAAVAERERAIALDPNNALLYAILAQTLSYVGAAYYLAGRPEEAIAPLKQFLTRYPNILSAHLTLAAVYSELGKETEARAEAAEVLRLNPQFSLDVHKERAPIKDPATLERHIAALRKAGLK